MIVEIPEHESYIHGIKTCACCLGKIENIPNLVKFKKPIKEDGEVLIPSGRQALCDSCYDEWRLRLLK